MATRTAYAGTAAANDTLTAANFNKLPGGWVGYVTATANQGSITSEVDVTGLTVTLTLVSGRRYRAWARARFDNDSAGNGVLLRIYNDATQIASDVVEKGTANDDDMAAPWAILDGDGSSHTIKVTAEQRSAGTVTLQASSTNPMILLVEDIGPDS